MSLKRVKLNYREAVSKTAPAGKVIVPSNHLEMIDRAIQQKVKQNKRGQFEKVLP